MLGIWNRGNSSAPQMLGIWNSSAPQLLSIWNGSAPQVLGIWNSSAPQMDAPSAFSNPAGESSNRTIMARAHYSRGRQLMNGTGAAAATRRPEALVAFAAAVELEPTHTAALVALGELARGVIGCAARVPNASDAAAAVREARAELALWQGELGAATMLLCANASAGAGMVRCNFLLSLQSNPVQIYCTAHRLCSKCFARGLAYHTGFTRQGRDHCVRRILYWPCARRG
eukprot:SAG11_NODE_6656_length_1272_cov_1.258312_3_plen_229_part_00